MKKALLTLSFLSSLHGLGWAQNSSLQYFVDLNKVENDQLRVRLNVPQLQTKEAIFHLPKIVPGTYSVYDFGRFVVELKAYDKKGKALKVEKVDPNSWKIKKAKKLSHLEYLVEDTWDTDKKNVVFEPAGTNIDKNVFVLNNHGIFGFFKGMERQPLKLNIERPATLYGGTSLQRTGGDHDTDIFEAESYHELVDAPILYAPLDTAMIKIGTTDVLIHTYSPTGKVNSKALVKDIQPILEAQKAYLGGQLPVDRYAFLIFLNPEGQFYLSGAAGALEHSYSSFYCLFEGEPSAIAQTVRDVAAHEFFHIVTPLNIHSEEIHYFNYIQPKMSKHLWLYEGVTEYSAQHVQVKQGLVTAEQFLSKISQKMRTAEQFKDYLAFTEMSEQCLDNHKSQYQNVYLKGALIGMCIDLILRTDSKGEYGIQNLLQDLSKKYGKDKPFKDSELFDEIYTITKNDNLKRFFEQHVAGKEKLPIVSLLSKVGIKYQEKGEALELSQFGFNPAGGLGFDQKMGKLKVEMPDKFGSDVMGMKKGDLLHKWNGEELTMANIQGVLGGYAMSAKEGQDLSVTVMRQSEEGTYKEVELKGKLQKVMVEAKHVFSLDPDASAEQIQLRKSWMGQ
jgi:predicted metalloprotease with PDZ domain